MMFISYVDLDRYVDPDMFPVDDEDGPGDNSASLIDVQTELFTSFMAENGLVKVEGGIEYDASKAGAITEMIDRISNEYENSSTTDWATWKRFGLSGDDDVDYHGGYVSAVIEAADAYIAAQSQ